MPAGTQKPLSQRPVQQSAFALHVAPLASHVEAMHFPSAPQAFEQQSDFVVHVPPFGRQSSAAAHVPLVQAFEQHAEGPVHPWPLPLHPLKAEIDAQLPLSQRFEQQSALVLQEPVPESHSAPPSPPFAFTSEMSSDPQAVATMVVRTAKRTARRFIVRG